MGPELDLGGIFPPIPTPFDPEGELALAELQSNLERWNEQPLAGYVVGGSNGEFVLLSDDERVAVTEAAREVIPEGRLLIAGAGAQSTRRTILLCRRMAEAGADALLVVTPSYYRGLMTAAPLQRHYRAVADASPVPVILYNVPANTNINLPLDVVSRLSEHANIAGIKDSSGDVIRIAETVATTPTDFQVLAGSASFLLPSLSVGAVGAVSALANIAGSQLVELMTAFETGDAGRSRALQAAMLAPNRAVTALYGVPGLKAALDMIGYYGGPVRGPLLGLGENEIDDLRGTLTAAGILSE